MPVMQIIFIIVSAVTLISAVMVVTDRNLFHAALYMMLSFLGVAGLYVLLENGFMAATQLLVYIGAISILVIFAIMMTRRLMGTTEPPFNSQWGWGGVASLLLFGLISSVMYQLMAFNPNPVKLEDGTLDPDAIQPIMPLEAEDAIRSMVTDLGVAFTSSDQYVLAFELASVLLLAALVGSIIVARPDVDAEEDEA